jgi:spermidine synthase
VNQESAVLDRVAKPITVAPTLSFTPPAWLNWNFAVAIFTSAFLLFQVQPIISKFILPWFGGAPSVWTTCMLFFQAALFCGYLYAHLSQRFLAPKWQGALHLGLLVAAVLLLPIEPSERWKPIDSNDPVGRILLLLGATVGLPYFLLSSTGPLLQSWFSRAYQHRSPYRLYALSNIGSLLALLSYPFFVETRLDLPGQTQMWSYGYVVFALLCGLPALWLYRRSAALPRPDRASHESTSVAELRVAWLWFDRFAWVALAGMASMMLLATTNHACAEIAPVPLLFIAPLTIYLLSFIICFDHPRWYQRGFFGALTALSVLVIVGEYAFHKMYEWPYLPLPAELGVSFVMLFGLCMCCHGEVVRLRPDPRHLTEFYLLISAGGVLGGAFVSLIAPHVFNTYIEWVIGLVLAFVFGCGLVARSLRNRGTLPAVLSNLPLAAIPLGIWFILYWNQPDPKAIRSMRNFFGAVSVREHEADDPAYHHYSFRSGAIDHGKQYVAAEKRREKISYFYPDSGAGKSMLFMKQAHPEGIRVGVLGMGVGLLAAYGEKNDQFRFYEINPNVMILARDPFTFLADFEARGGKCDVVEGDGRLSLEREPANKFHVLYLDAFTGDAPPVHLLTEEAFKIYQKHLADDGLICVNVINTYVNLVPVIEQAAKNFGWQVTRIYHDGEDDKLYYRTDFMILAPNNPAFIGQNPDQLPGDDYLEPKKEVPLWTDQYSNLWSILKTK